MHRHPVIFAVTLIFCLAAPAWGDNLLQVDVWAIWTHNAYPKESVRMSFLYDPDDPLNLDGQFWVAADTFHIESSGYLGEFHAVVNGGRINAAVDGYALPIINDLGDEIDLWHWAFPVGTNTMGISIYSCRSAPCREAYPSSLGSVDFIGPDWAWTTVYPVSQAVVPEPGAVALLLASSALAVPLRRLCCRILLR